MTDPEKRDPLAPKPDPFAVDRFQQAVDRQKAAKTGGVSANAKKGLGILALLAVLAGKSKGLLVSLVTALKIFKFTKLLTTGSSMLVSVLFYAQTWGWRFALGFVLTLFVHEMGHVIVAARHGIPVSAPLFIPGLGAMIFQKQPITSRWIQALVGIGGPIGGTLAGLVCLGLGIALQAPLFSAIAYTTFFLNLFNLIPLAPFDGGWIVGAVSPRLWIFGLVVFVGLYLSNVIHNPFILMIVIMSLPGLWHELRGEHGLTDATNRQKLLMGGAYLLLCGALAFLMIVAFELAKMPA